MITQIEMEAALESSMASSAIVRALMTRFLCGEDIERGPLSITHVLRFDRQMAIRMLQHCVRNLAASIRVERERRLMAIAQDGRWARHYRRIWIEYAKACWSLAKLRMAILLYRMHVVDVIDLEKIRTGLSGYLRTGAPLD